MSMELTNWLWKASSNSSVLGDGFEYSVDCVDGRDASCDVPFLAFC